MFLIDDIIFAPFKGLISLCKEIYKRAKEELDDTPEKLQQELLELQELFESGKISEEQYLDREESVMLRLNILQESGNKENEDIK